MEGAFLLRKKCKDAQVNQIEVTRDGAVLSVQLNRPDKKNAINKGMYGDLNAALTEATEDFGIRAVVLSGAGDCFTAGNDIFDFANDVPTDSSAPGFQFIQNLHNFPKPLIAAVHGRAVGIGTTALLHCDAVYAAPDTQFSMPFVTLGLVPEAGSSFLFPRLVGLARASEILLTGRTFNASEGREIGLVNSIEEDPLAAAMKTAQRIAEQPPTAVMNTKALIKSSNHGPVEAVMEAEGELFRIALQSEEAQAAFMKFMSGKGK
jgi:enoyl-CoA hydratase/carnithine racemase